MQNFLRLGSGENVLPILSELKRKPKLWDQNDFRKTLPCSALTRVSDILIRYPQVSTGDTYVSAQGLKWQPAAKDLPSIRGIILRLMTAVGAYSLGRVIISRLQPGATIDPHVDVGTGYTDQDGIVRYHVCLEGAPGSLFICGNETVSMLPGEVWWFAADVLHSCRNESNEDRTHLVVDLLLWGRE